MGKLNELLSLAHRRASDLNLPYAGALTPAEAFEVWKLAPGAQLVDVRTRAEWDWVGRVPEAVEIEWQTYPGGQPNPNFLSELTHQVDREALVLFLCRSGGRSDGACQMFGAKSQLGFTQLSFAVRCKL